MSLVVVGLVLTATSIAFFVPLAIYTATRETGIVSYGGAQLVVSIVFGVVWYCVLIILLDLRDSTAREVTRQLIERARVDQLAMKQGEVIDAIQREIEQEVANEMAMGRTQVTGLLSAIGSRGEGGGREAAATLRAISEDRVRPLSRRLVGHRETVDLRPSLAAIVRTTWRTQPLKPVLIGCIIFLTFIGSEIEAFGVVRGGGLLMVGVVVVIAVASGANWLLQRFSRRRNVILLSAFLLLQLNTFGTNSVRNRWADGHIGLAFFAVQVAFFVFLTLATSAFPVWRSSRSGVVSLFREAMDREAQDACLRGEQVAFYAQRAAQLLHGEVQSRLHACAMTIEAACATGDLDAVTESLEEALRTFDRALTSRVHGSDQDDVILSREVLRKVELWRGLVAIECFVDPEVGSLHGAPAVVAGRVVEEGISNAVRHAAATQVRASVGVEGDQMRIEIIDNGTGPVDSMRVGSTGLGLAMVDRLSRGQWTLGRDGGSTHLVVSVPLGIGSTVNA